MAKRPGLTRDKPDLMTQCELPAGGITRTAAPSLRMAPFRSLLESSIRAGKKNTIRPKCPQSRLDQRRWASKRVEIDQIKAIVL